MSGVSLEIQRGGTRKMETRVEVGLQEITLVWEREQDVLEFPLIRMLRFHAAKDRVAAVGIESVLRRFATELQLEEAALVAKERKGDETVTRRALPLQKS